MTLIGWAVALLCLGLLTLWWSYNEGNWVYPTPGDALEFFGMGSMAVVEMFPNGGSLPHAHRMAAGSTFVSPPNRMRLKPPCLFSRTMFARIGWLN
jgi:hypothetical protein